MDLAHLGHVEILTPKPDESLEFFTNVFGMTESGRKGDGVYLRGWDDYERATLKVTAAKTAGVAHTAFRTRSPEALERRVAALKDTPHHVGWNDGDVGHGPAYQCRDSDGHLLELYYETEWYQPPAELKPALKNQAQKYPARGISVRRLDHLNFFAVDIPGARRFYMEKLGMRMTEQILFESGEQAVWLTCTNKTYDLAIAHDHSGVPGRFHHVTYAVDSREDV
ncbi:MAG: VOC family protein, partial [Xanthobacteraceae bacterium]